MAEPARVIRIFVLLGILFAYSICSSIVSYAWTRAVIRGRVFDGISGLVVLHLLIMLPITAAAGIAGFLTRRYASAAAWSWYLLVAGAYIAFAHYASYDGVFRSRSVEYRLTAFIEAIVLFAVVVVSGNLRRAQAEAPLRN